MSQHIRSWIARTAAMSDDSIEQVREASFQSVLPRGKSRDGGFAALNSRHGRGGVLPLTAELRRQFLLPPFSKMYNSLFFNPSIAPRLGGVRRQTACFTDCCRSGFCWRNEWPIQPSACRRKPLTRFRSSTIYLVCSSWSSWLRIPIQFLRSER